MVFGVEPARYFGVLAEGVHHAVVIPAPVHIAGAALVAPYVATFGVDIGLAALGVTSFHVVFAAGIRIGVDVFEVLFPGPAGQVFVPGVDVGFGMATPAANGVVFDEAGWVELFGESVHRCHPFLGFGQVFALLFAIFLHFGGQPPGFVEGDPGKNGRVVVVPFNHFPQGVFTFLTGISVGFAPGVG